MRTRFPVIATAAVGCCLTAGFFLAVAQERQPVPRPGQPVQPGQPGQQQIRPGEERRSGFRTETRRDTTSSQTRVSSRHIHRSTQIIGSNVVLSGGTKWGVVEDFVLSPRGCVQYVIVEYEDEFVPVPWSIAEYDFDSRVLNLDIEQTRIREVPTFTEFSELSGTEFTQRVDKFFGVESRDVESSRTRSTDVDRRDSRTRTRDSDRDTDTRRSRDDDSSDTDRRSDTQRRSDTDRRSDTQRRSDSDAQRRDSQTQDRSDSQRNSDANRTPGTGPKPRSDSSPRSEPKTETDDSKDDSKKEADKKSDDNKKPDETKKPTAPKPQ